MKSTNPKSPIGRLLNAAILLIISLASFVAFYLIRFEVCGDYPCADLAVMGIWYLFSPGFMVYGALVMVLSRFIQKEVELPSGISDCITVALLIATLMMLFIPYAISIEIARGIQH